MHFRYKSEREGYHNLLMLHTPYDYYYARQKASNEQKLGAWIYYAQEYCAGRLTDGEPLDLEYWQGWLEKVKNLPYEPFDREQFV
jgi:hypothetical protein